MPRLSARQYAQLIGVSGSYVSRLVRDGNGWRLSGSKTYITNGQAADLVIVCARTSPPTAEDP